MMFKKYYKNTSTFRCAECNYVWTHNIWQWLLTLVYNNNISRHRYVKCPRCGARHWLKAIKVVD